MTAAINKAGVGLLLFVVVPVKWTADDADGIFALIEAGGLIC